ERHCHGPATPRPAATAAERDQRRDGLSLLEDFTSLDAGDPRGAARYRLVLRAVLRSPFLQFASLNVQSASSKSLSRNRPPRIRGSPSFIEIMKWTTSLP